MMRHCTTTLVWQVRLASTEGTADSSSTFQQMMQHCTTNSVWQVKNGFNKRHSRHLINVSTNDAALHYKLSVAGQTGFNKRPPKAGLSENTGDRVNECPDSGPNKGASSVSDRRDEVCTCWNSRQLINSCTCGIALQT